MQPGPCEHALTDMRIKLVRALADESHEVVLRRNGGNLQVPLAIADCWAARMLRKLRTAATAFRLPCALFLGFLLVLASSIDVRADPSAREREIRGALVYKIARFVSWPDEESASREPMVFGIFGDADFAQLIAENVAGLKIHDRPVEVVEITGIDAAMRCHVVFIAADEPPVVREWLAVLGPSPVLTVGSQPGFLASGGIINLEAFENRIVFSVNLEASAQSGLGLDSRLLRAAHRVEGRP